MTDKPIMICPNAKGCEKHHIDGEFCMHAEEHKADSTCVLECTDALGGCFVAEFTPVDDIGDEEEIR